MTDTCRTEGCHSVTPRLFADGPKALARFLGAAFGATGEFDGERPAEMRIGDSLVMVGGTAVREATSSAFYVYVPDTDEVYRGAMVHELAGNTWQIATRQAQQAEP